MIKIGICDDEPLILQQLFSIIDRFARSEGMAMSIDCFVTGDLLLKQREPFDLVFLDIDMPGTNGLETAKQLRAKNAGIQFVYVTHYHNLTRQALSVRAFGYINKPIKEEEIVQEVRDFLRLYQEISAASKSRQKVSFLSENGYCSFDISNIIYFEYIAKNHVKMCTQEKYVVIKQSLNKICECLEKYEFDMPHKSFIVNLEHIKNIRGLTLVMNNDCEIPIAQKRAKEFRIHHNNFLQKILVDL